MITKDGRIKGPLLSALVGQAISKSKLNDRVIKPGGRKEGMEEHITAENIIHNMKRYDHQDPHATYSISHIARMIGEAPAWTRQKLQEMKIQGLVSSFQNDGVRWKAL